MAVFIASTDRVGLADSKRAATPDTCGVAIEVPLNSAYPFDGTVLAIETPGAAKSTLAGP
jgi:hypothetical protein